MTFMRIYRTFLSLDKSNTRRPSADLNRNITEKRNKIQYTSKHKGLGLKEEEIGKFNIPFPKINLHEVLPKLAIML